MVNTIDIQTIEDGSRNTIIKIDILGDGSGDESGTVIFDASAYLNTTPKKKLWRYEYALQGFVGDLDWDATSPAPLATLVENHDEDVQWTSNWFSGYSNTYFAGRTGDILLTTVGLGAGDRGHIILYVKHKELLNGTR